MTQILEKVYDSMHVSGNHQMTTVIGRVPVLDIEIIAKKLGIKLVLTKEGMVTSFKGFGSLKWPPGPNFCVAFSIKRTLPMCVYVRYGFIMYSRLASKSG